MSDDPSDYILLKRAKQGEEGAFVLLYERHRDSVYRFVFRMLGCSKPRRRINPPHLRPSDPTHTPMRRPRSVSRVE